VLERIHTFLKDYFRAENFILEPINNSASDRKYFRVRFDEEDSYILTFSENTPETRTFLYFSTVFKREGIAVPSILKVDNSQEIYLQEDVGNTNLLSLLIEQKETAYIKNLYQKSLDELIKLQFQVSQKIDYSYCYDFQKFNYTLVNNDLNYFKFYFFQPLEIPFSNRKLLNEFSDIAQTVSTLQPQGFMYRDFQTRNIMIKDSQPFFIDYQGGMKGITVYDLVSLLWQAKARLSSDFKKELKDYYFQQVLNETNISEIQLEKAYQYCLLIRLLQVLGVYGFRGILQKKQHFLDSIFFGIDNLKTLIRESTVITKYPELLRISQELFNAENRIKNLIQH
jgi:aminoglycoside/choline kinase family phosphotransferase